MSRADEPEPPREEPPPMGTADGRETRPRPPDGPGPEAAPGLRLPEDAAATAVLGTGSSGAGANTWDEASGPDAERLAGLYEQQFEASGPGSRPDPATFLKHSGATGEGAVLAVLRADLSLRWQAGDRVRVEWYRDRFAPLPAETLVALAYEEFCLREDEQGRPEPAEYYRRFPALVGRLRRVLDIHGLVGHGSTTALQQPDPATAALPEAGQTIAGFRLVEELGRGSFARVFRAEERQLADRPVALKVARTGSREPQTLARLQHTNIVPVHSFRTDPATGLHLLCMPYFGRVTLARLLEEPQVQAARQGAELLMALDRLDPDAPTGHGSTADRRAVAGLPYARAIAWWGARLAEALQHAHDRGVLHRDIKPSNVLLTADGQPMLLDFNLAQTTALEADAQAPALGGTLAYMAPEHLEALAGGDPDLVDGRSDVYALGVVLFETMGSRPFPAPLPTSGTSLTECLRRAAAERRQPPRLRVRHPETPPAFEAVVRRCLAPDPADRYPSAAALAADLKAVADDAPLRWGREPLLSRVVRGVRRNRRKIALAVPVVLGLAAAVALYRQSQVADANVRAQVDRLLADGVEAAATGRYDVASSQYQAASELAASVPALRDLAQSAHERHLNAEEARKVRSDADNLLRAAERLRFGLLGFDTAGLPADAQIEAVLAPLYVLEHPNWTERPELTMLEDGQRTLLVREVEELLFLWSVSKGAGQADPEALRLGLRLCDRALVFTQSPGPWQSLRERFRAWLDGRPPRIAPEPSPEAETSAWACFQRALIHSIVEHETIGPPLAWLDRSVRLDPSRYWSQYYLAHFFDRAGQEDLALAHYSAAIALRNDSPFALFARAVVYWRRGAWERALEDLDRAHACAAGSGFEDPDLERGLIRFRLGYLAGARADFETLIQIAGPQSPLGRSARLNWATLAVEAGRIDQARAEYAALLNDVPSDADPSPILQGRIELALRTGRPADAVADVAQLVALNPRSPDWQALRARVALDLGRPEEAEQAARQALELDPGALARERLHLRTLLALGHDAELTIDDPAVLDELPGDRSRLRSELRAAAARLAGNEDPHALRQRAVLLAALRDPEARDVVDHAVAVEPRSERVRLVRGRVLRHLGDHRGAVADAEAGLAFEPAEPTLLELRGRLALDANQPRAALADFDRAAHHGGTPTLSRNRAEALDRLGYPEAAVEAWTRQLQVDSQDLEAFLGRARAYGRLGAWDRALADLESAAGSAHDRPAAMLRVVAEYTRCLYRRPDHAGRVAMLGARALADLIAQTWWNPVPARRAAD